MVCRSSSLCSVYQLLRCGLCPYFYLCANQYTVLFVSAGVRGCSSLSALITPTTSGMREALQREGLYHIYPCWGIYTHTHVYIVITGAELNLPLAPSQLPAYDDEGSDAEDDSAAATWLSAMGLPPHDLPTLQPQALYPHHYTRTHVHVYSSLCVCVCVCSLTGVPVSAKDQTR